MVACIDCQSPLTQTPGKGARRLRCDACIRVYKNESRKAYRRGESYRGCLACGKAMPPASGFTYCEACRPAPASRSIREIPCLTCGDRFETVVATQKWCSGLCRQRWWTAKRLRVSTYRPPTDADRARWKAREERRKTAGLKRSPGRTGGTWRHLRDQVLAEEPNCWLCHQPIDHCVAYPHPLYPTVDHVVQLAHGGDPTDRNNLRAAHFRCNNRRNARRRPAIP